ncbi:MAG: L,D-transpeptidase family protein, partial [Hyphomicrobium sp.]
APDETAETPATRTTAPPQQTAPTAATPATAETPQTAITAPTPETDAPETDGPDAGPAEALPSHDAAERAASPSETAAPPAVAATDTIAPAATPMSLPIKRYFETKAAATLHGFDAADRQALQTFYDARMGQSLWVTPSGFNAAGEALIAEIRKADDWGLRADDYRSPGLAQIGSGTFSEDDLTDAEIKLSLVAMAYARDARGGRIPDPTTQLSSYIDRKPKLIERPKLLEALAAAPSKDAYLRGLHPKHPQFEMLRQKLMALKTAPPQDRERIPSGPNVSPGKSHAHVRLVRERLNVAMPSARPDGGTIDQNFYDPVLADAVKAYKHKHGIEPVNATINGGLRTALNARSRVDERLLLANMEQWRWMPDDLGSTHIWVNIPEFLVRVVKNNTLLHEERIVTGRVDTQTPVFSDSMRTVVFQPRWTVPESIKVRELLPSLRGGRNPIDGRGLVMQRNGRTVSAWDVDWYRQDIRNYDVFQPPGGSNVLGVVKFLFPNKHAVYLHDTPSKGLFNEQVRTFSHGCMRVRNPVRLAEVIMSEDKGWERGHVRDLIESGPDENDVTLERPLPVHVTYFTAWVRDDGEIAVFGDVYGHEQRVKLGLDGRFDAIARHRDHLLPAEVPVARRREDWDALPGESRRRGAQRGYAYGFEDFAAPPSPAGKPPRGVKIAQPRKKSSQSVSDLLNGMFGN